VPLEFGKVGERVGAAQLGRVNQAHKQVADLRSVQRAIEQSVLPMQNRPFQASLDDVVIEWGPRFPQE
jgi:hypothetical protein